MFVRSPGSTLCHLDIECIQLDIVRRHYPEHWNCQCTTVHRFYLHNRPDDCISGDYRCNVLTAWQWPRRWHIEIARKCTFHWPVSPPLRDSIRVGNRTSSARRFERSDKRHTRWTVHERPAHGPRSYGDVLDRSWCSPRCCEKDSKSNRSNDLFENSSKYSPLSERSSTS